MINLQPGVAHIFLGSLEMPLKQHSDLRTEAFNYCRNPSSDLIHSLAFCFIIKLSSIFLPIYTLSQACAGAINISMVFLVCICEKEMLFVCVALHVLLQLKSQDRHALQVFECLCT